MRLFKSINFPLKRPPTIADNVFDGIASNLDEIDQLVSEYINKAKNVRESRRFSKEGQRDELERLGDEVDGKLAKISQVQAGYTTNIAKAEAAMRPQPIGRSDASVLREAMEHQEIRNHVATFKDSFEVDNYYREAVNSGNELVADALERDPTGRIRFANPKLVDELKFERGRRRNPEAAALYRDYTFAATEVRSGIAHAQKALQAEGLKLPSLDRIAAVAA